jgi:hypothetical protein
MREGGIVATVHILLQINNRSLKVSDFETNGRRKVCLALTNILWLLLDLIPFSLRMNMVLVLTHF